MANPTSSRIKFPLHPFISPNERLSIWEKARGMWKHKKPEPIQELKKMRKEWDRRLLPPKK